MGNYNEDSKKMFEILGDFRLRFKSEIVTKNLKFVTHFHEKWEIVYYVKSHNTAFINEINYEISSGNILVIPPRQLHSIRYNIETNYTRYVLHLSDDYIIEILGEIVYEEFKEFFTDLKYKKISLHYSSINKFNQLFHFLNDEVIKSEDYYNSLIISYSTTILLEIFKHFRKFKETNMPSSNEIITQQIIKYINEHFSEEITLDIFEKDLFLSKSYICRLFSQTVGGSIIEYTQYRRIIEAQKLLEYTNTDILDICFECGFNNLPHFYRVFKKVCLMSPKKYRDSKHIQNY